MKKFIICFGIIICEILLAALIAKIFDISTQNKWLSGVTSNIIFITICVMLFNVAKSKKGTFISLFLYFIIFLSVLSCIFITLTLFFDW